MRVTNRMMANNYLRDMRRNLNNMQKLNDQLTSGKEIRRPSDNPFKVARSMQLHTDINTNTQYNENIKDTINWLDTTDTALDQMTNVMQRVRELMVSSGNAAYSHEEKKAINDEINEKVSELAQILNSNFDGKYVFGGTKTDTKPVLVSKNPVTGLNEINLMDTNGNPLDPSAKDTYSKQQLNMLGSNLQVEISQGVIVDYNVNVSDVLLFKDEDGNSVNVMNLLKDITNNLNSDSVEDNNKVIEENLIAMDKSINNLMKKRAEVGAMQNRMESAQDKNEDESINMKDILSQTEDVDFTEKSMEHSIAMTVYMAALQTSSKILPQTLMDFIR